MNNRLPLASVANCISCCVDPCAYRALGNNAAAPDFLNYPVSRYQFTRILYKQVEKVEHLWLDFYMLPIRCQQVFVYIENAMRKCISHDCIRLVFTTLFKLFREK